MKTPSSFAAPHDSPLDMGLHNPLGAALPAGIGTSHEVSLPPMPRKARMVLHLLRRLAVGSLQLTLPQGQVLHFGHGEPSARITLANYEVFDQALSSGDIGFAQTYIDGDWHAESLIAVLDLMVANRALIERAVYGSWWGQWIYRLQHLLNRNTKAGARRNIHAHYDLGNAFYKLWLDPSMTYSSALFESLDSPPTAERLHQAQTAKYQRILDELGQAGSTGRRILEIGCGWGGFAELAAKQGAHVTGLTLSTEQLGFAKERLARAGLQSQVDFALRDYRDERQRYDAIVSIEMFEAVGESYWNSYFECLKRSLAPDGVAVVQTITIDEALFERYRKGTDFIQQFIFPGGMLPSATRFSELAQAHGLQVTNQFRFGQHYAHTLRLWREAFTRESLLIRAQGFDEAFMRTWEFYLVYCEAAFRHGNTDVMQVSLRHA